ncbi:MAG: MFS transporter [Candidatus Bathyarchaeota archaeon]|nr:MFS transporter [Candidatus Termiticorpusculum sp.]
MSKTPVLNPYAISLKTPTNLMGIIAAASTIPGILISLPAASLTDHFDRKKILLFATFIFASAPFLYLIVTNWWQLALVRFYHGFATATFIPVAETIIANHFPTKRGERISAFNSATYIGRGIAPFLGGTILFITNYRFHTLYLAVAIAGVTSLVITLLLLSETKTYKNNNTKPVNIKVVTNQMLKGWLTIAKNKYTLVVVFVQACQYYVYGIVEFYLVQYMMDVADFNALEVSVVIGVQVVSMIVFRIVFGRFSDKHGRRLPIVLGCLISGILLLFVPFTTQFVLLFVTSLGYGLSFALVVSSTSPLICELAPSNLIGTSMGFLSTAMDVGQILGPIVSGVILATVFSYMGLFFSLMLLLIVSALVFLFSGVAKKF